MTAINSSNPSLNKDLQVEDSVSVRNATLLNRNVLSQSSYLQLPPEEDDAVRKLQQEWTIRSPPKMQPLCAAILEDNYVVVSEQMNLLPQNRMRPTFFPIEMESPAGHSIMCKSFSVGHLLAMFASQTCLTHLDEKGQLHQSLFRSWADLQLEYVVFSHADKNSAQNKETLRGVPPSHCAVMRDNWPALVWLLYRGYVANAKEVCIQGRNLLHVAVEEESIKTMIRLLQDRKLIRWPILRDLLQMRDVKYHETPFARACSRQDPAMLVNIIRHCPMEFVKCREDITGMGKSIFNVVILNTCDPALAIDIIKEFMKRGAQPLPCPWDSYSPIEAVLESESFVGDELIYIIKILLKYGARISSSTLINLLTRRFRSNEEILAVTGLLLRKCGTEVLIGNHEDNETLSHDNIVLQMLRNPNLSVSRVESLCLLFQQYIDLTALLPHPKNIAEAIVERIPFSSTSSMDKFEELTEQMMPLTCFVYKLLGSQSSLHQARFVRALLRCVFEFTDYSTSERPHERAFFYMRTFFDCLEHLAVDFNYLINGKIALFSIFSSGVPEDLVPRLMEILPKSFHVNLQDKSHQNLASLAIVKCQNNFKAVSKIFEILSKRQFDFQETVRENETLAIHFLRHCGTAFDNMEIQDNLNNHQRQSFFGLLKFLFAKGVKMVQGGSNVLSMSFLLKRCTIVEELLRIDPTLICSVEVVAILDFIRDKPMFLEYLNKESADYSIASVALKNLCHEKKTKETMTDGDVEMRIQGSLEECQSERLICLIEGQSSPTLRDLWVTYVRENHSEMLRLGNDYAEQILAIYDYFVHSHFDERQSNKVCSAVIEFSTYYKPCVAKDSKKNHRANVDILNSIVNSDVRLREHPFVTEYFEFFYRKAFLFSLLFMFIHLGFLTLLNGYSLAVLNPFVDESVSRGLKKSNASGHYHCFINNCSLLSHNDEVLVNFFTGPCTEKIDSNDTCFKCPIHTYTPEICLPETIRFSTCPMETINEDSWVHMQYPLTAMSIIGIARELAQLSFDPKNYAHEWFQNLVELIMYTFAFIFSMNFSTECRWATAYKLDWQFRLGIISVLFTWIMLFFHTSKFPAFGTYVIMFYTALRRGIVLLITFASLYVGFGFVFCLTLGNLYDYRSVIVSLGRLSSMMLGEINYKDIFSSDFNSEAGTRIERPWLTVNHPVVSQLIVVFFIVLICVVLMNLFVGLIVGDVDNINRMAETKKWKMNVEFIDYTERVNRKTINFFVKLKNILCCVCCRRRHSSLDDPQLLLQSPSSPCRNLVTQVSKSNICVASRQFQEQLLHVCDLRWWNVLKSKVLATSFGFVPRILMMDNLRKIEERKAKRARKYKKSQHFSKPDKVVESEKSFVEQDVFLKARAPASESHIDIDSVVTIHGEDQGDERIRKISIPAQVFNMLDEKGGAAEDLFAPRHDRRLGSVQLTSAITISASKAGTVSARPEAALGRTSVLHMSRSELCRFYASKSSTEQQRILKELSAADYRG